MIHVHLQPAVQVIRENLFEAVFRQNLLFYLINLFLLDVVHSLF